MSTRRLFTHPVVQFAVAVLVAFVLATTLTSWLSSRAAEREAIADARSVTEVLARGVVEPALNRGVAYGEPAAVSRFDQVLRQRLQLPSVRRIKLWSAQGRIVYSDEPRLVGERFGLDVDERAVLHGGGSAAEISDLSKPENRFERGGGHTVEVYSRVVSPEGDPLLFEAYFTLADVNERKAEIAHSFRPVTLGGGLVLALLVTPLVWWLTRRLRRDSEARETLLRAAAEASDAERRRIARDLHDGVVQDLAGAAFILAGATRGGRHDPELLEQVADSVRGSLRSLRSLLVEIYPADLHETGLTGALGDLLAAAEVDGVVTELEVDDSGLPATVVAVVWRVAQEAVRNAVRHGRPQHLRVAVRRDGDRVRLVVEDDGVGFERAAGTPHDAGHFGLRGMRDLIREAGGTLEVESSPGHGTRVELEVGA